MKNPEFAHDARLDSGAHRCVSSGAHCGLWAELHPGTTLAKTGATIPSRPGPRRPTTTPPTSVRLCPLKHQMARG